MAYICLAWIVLRVDLALSEVSLLKGDFGFGNGAGKEWAHYGCR